MKSGFLSQAGQGEFFKPVLTKYTASFLLLYFEDCESVNHSTKRNSLSFGGLTSKLSNY